jgi:hypothetical protein
MSRNQNTLSAEIHPVVRKVWKINTPILGLLIDMSFETESIHAARLASEKSFVIFSLIFISDPTVDREERWKKSG